MKTNKSKRKLGLEKIKITRLGNMDSVFGGSCGCNPTLFTNTIGQENGCLDITKTIPLSDD